MAEWRWATLTSPKKIRNIRTRTRKRNSPWLGVQERNCTVSCCYFIFGWRWRRPKNRKMKTRTKTRLDQLSPRLYSMYTGWFMMRAFPLKWEIHAPFAHYTVTVCLDVLSLQMPQFVAVWMWSSFTPSQQEDNKNLEKQKQKTKYGWLVSLVTR